jgi:hypothetical protein
MCEDKHLPSILRLAYELTACDRTDTRAARLRRLHDALFMVTSSTAEPLVQGEEGGIGSIALNRAPSDLNDGPTRPLACLMFSEIVAAGVAACHEMTTGESVSAATEIDLQNRFVAFGGYPGWNDPLPVLNQG